MHNAAKPLTDILDRLRGVGIFYYAFCALMLLGEPRMFASPLLLVALAVVAGSSTYSEVQAWRHRNRPPERVESLGAMLRLAAMLRASGVGFIVGYSFFLYGIDTQRLIAGGATLCFCLGTVMVLRPNLKLMVACLSCQLLFSSLGAFATLSSLGVAVGILLLGLLYFFVRHGQLENYAYWDELHRNRKLEMDRQRAQEMSKQHLVLLVDQSRRNAIVAERSRIAGQWHDELLAGLSAASLQIETALRRLPADADVSSLRLAISTLRHCRDEAREAITDLMAVTGHEVDLITLLREELAPLAKDLGLFLRFQKPLPELPAQNPKRAREILHICQEAMRNASRHGKASTLTVTLKREEERFFLELVDNGSGFQPELVGAGHFGLQIMQQRATRLLGSLSVQTAPGQGTKIQLNVPIREKSRMNPAKILIVEDQFLSRLALKTLLAEAPQYTVVAEAASGEQGVSLFEQTLPDLVILDLRLPDMPGIEVLQRMLVKDPSAKIIVMSNLTGPEQIANSLSAGALGYLGKDASPNEIFEAIDRVSRGLQYLSASVHRAYEQRNQYDELTPRELDVLQLLVQGFSNKGIADQLGIAEKTVRVHMSSILSKLQVEDRTQAAVVALQRGFVEVT